MKFIDKIKKRSETSLDETTINVVFTCAGLEVGLYLVEALGSKVKVNLPLQVAGVILTGYAYNKLGKQCVASIKEASKDC